MAGHSGHTLPVEAHLEQAGRGAPRGGPLGALSLAWPHWQGSGAWPHRAVPGDVRLHPEED
eukprot:5324750-Lingulodinium_polyedra.AAC.1